MVLLMSSLDPIAESVRWHGSVLKGLLEMQPSDTDLAEHDHRDLQALVQDRWHWL